MEILRRLSSGNSGLGSRKAKNNWDSDPSGRFGSVFLLNLSGEEDQRLATEIQIEQSIPMFRGDSAGWLLSSFELCVWIYLPSPLPHCIFKLRTPRYHHPPAVHHFVSLKVFWPACQPIPNRVTPLFDYTGMIIQHFVPLIDECLPVTLFAKPIQALTLCSLRPGLSKEPGCIYLVPYGQNPNLVERQIRVCFSPLNVDKWQSEPLDHLSKA